MKTISLYDMQMHYETYGKGDPLILLHGFTGSSADWKPMIPEFSKYYHTIVPDMRGHGQSTNPRQEFTHKQASLDIFALLETLHIKKFHAIGISGGGNILLHMATQQPKRIKNMVLVSATSYFPAQARNFMRQFSLKTLSQEEQEAVRKRHKHGEEQIEKLFNQARQFHNNYDDMNFTKSYLSTISAKSLLIGGDKDPLYPVNILLEMYEAIPNSYLWVIPNGGHSPVFAEMQDSFIKMSLAFLQDAWSK